MVGGIDRGHPAANASAPGRRNFVLLRTDIGGKPQVNRCGAFVNEVLHDENGAVAKAEFGLVDASVAVNHAIETGWFVVQPRQFKSGQRKEDAGVRANTCGVGDVMRSADVTRRAELVAATLLVDARVGGLCEGEPGVHRPWHDHVAQHQTKV